MNDDHDSMPTMKQGERMERVPEDEHSLDSMPGILELPWFLQKAGPATVSERWRARLFMLRKSWR